MTPHHHTAAIASTNSLTAFTARQPASSSVAAHAVQTMMIRRKLVCITFSNSACSDPDDLTARVAATRSLGTRGKKDRASIQIAALTNLPSTANYGAQMRRILFTEH